MDLKFAVRTLRNNPSFTLLAILVMALGIGANTAMFSVVNAVLLKPLDYSNPDRIVSVLTKWSDDPVPSNISIPDFNDWYHQSTVFSAMAYYETYSTSAMTGPAAEYIQVARVSPEFFSVFSLEPAVGRLFSTDEQKPASGGAALISYSYWQSHFGGNARALGQPVRMFATPFPSSASCPRVRSLPAVLLPACYSKSAPPTPVPNAIVAILLALAALAASYFPARGASRLDPLTTLRT